MSFHSKFKFDYKTNCCKSVPGYHIATNFYTCHDSTVVVTGANICSNNIVLICTTAQHFRYIWVAWEKLLMQQVPWQNPLGNYTLTYYIDSWISYHQISNISHTLLGNRGVTIRLATIRYISRYTTHDMVHDTIQNQLIYYQWKILKHCGMCHQYCYIKTVILARNSEFKIN